MNTLMSLRGCAAVLALGAGICCPSTASAIFLDTQLAPIYQIGSGATIQVGHTVYARTDFNRLFAGGSYIAACAAAETLPTTGQRYLTAESTVGGNTLFVTVPRTHPARVNMPGFNASTLRGRRLDCTYNWISRGVESTYSIGPGGIGYTIGGGEASEGGTQQFVMDVPGIADEDEWAACTP